MLKQMWDNDLTVFPVRQESCLDKELSVLIYHILPRKLLSQNLYGILHLESSAEMECNFFTWKLAAIWVMLTESAASWYRLPHFHFGDKRVS